jgi:pimeloyl-ACP methyl ester carboxylesterase
MRYFGFLIVPEIKNEKGRSMNAYKTLQWFGLAVLCLFATIHCSRNHTIKFTDSQNNPIKIYSAEFGAKVTSDITPAIVFLHGNGYDHSIWEKQTKSPALQKYRLIAYDMRGHGKSTHFKDDKSYARQYSMKLHAEDLQQVLEYYKLNNAIVVGWSLGGHVVLRHFVNHPASRIGKAVIYGAIPSLGFAGVKDYPPLPQKDVITFLLNQVLLSPSISGETLHKYVSLCLEQEPEFDGQIKLPESELDKWSSIVASSDGYSRLGLLDGFSDIMTDLSDGRLDMSPETMMSYNIWQGEMISELEKIQTPVRLLVSESDIYPKEQIEYMANKNPEKFTLAYTGRTGHAVHYNSPEIFERELLKFIEK